MALQWNFYYANIIQNFIPHETVTCDDRDPPWMTRFIKKAINGNNLLHKCFVKNRGFGNNNSGLESLRLLQNNLSNIIETTKQQYFAKICQKNF